MEGTSLTTFNPATHIRTGAEQTIPQETSTTTVNEEGAIQQPTNGVEQPTSTPETTTTQPSENGQATVTETVPDNEASFSFGEPAATTTPTQEQTQQTPQYNWKEEITKIDKQELYQHLGLNDFAIKLNDHLLKGGKAADFIAMQGIDFDTVPDEELVRQDLKTRFPNLSSSEINRMYERKYGFNDETEETEKEDKIIDLKSAAYQVRLAKKNEQAGYKMPEPIPVKDERYEAWQEQVRNQESLKTEINNYYKEHPTTKQLHETKRVAISVAEGVEPFNIVLDNPDVLTNMMANSAFYKTPVLTKMGEPDVHRQQIVTLFETDPQKFITSIFNYGKSVAMKAKVAEGQNAQRTTMPVSTTIPQETTYSSGKYSHATHGK